MIIWAVFTLGYLFGVFFSLGVLLGKDKEGELVKSSITKELYANVWETHAHLIKPNYFKKPTKKYAPEKEINPSYFLNTQSA